jgi:hypothetical protein
MGLLGCNSNPEIQERLRQLSDKLDRLVASDAAPRPSVRQDRKLRGGIVPKAIERVLADAGKPMRVRDVHAPQADIAEGAGEVDRWLPCGPLAPRLIAGGHGGGYECLFASGGRSSGVRVSPALSIRSHR